MDNFCQRVLADLFGPDPAFLAFLASLTDFARVSAQSQRDLSLVRQSVFSSRIL